jgi:hypothetical protein
MRFGSKLGIRGLVLSTPKNTVSSAPIPTMHTRRTNLHGLPPLLSPLWIPGWRLVEYWLHKRGGVKQLLDVVDRHAEDES